MATLEDVKKALQQMAAEDESESRRQFARESLEHIEAGRVQREAGRVHWFVCKGCGGKAGWTDDRLGVVHMPPSCQLFRDTPAGEFRRMHGG